MPKSKTIRGDKVDRGGPLAEQIIDEGSVKVSGRKKVRKRRDDDDEFVESDLSKKILSQARIQQQELEEEHGAAAPPQSASHTIREKKSGILFGLKDEVEEEDELLQNSMAATEGMMGPVEVDPQEEAAFEAFMSKKGHRTLADIIQSKLEEKKTEVETVMSDDRGASMQELPPEVVNMLVKVREILKRYRSGKLPKAFKKLPCYTNWEQCLFITQPDQWTAAAMYAGTKIFSSNLPAALAQRFFSLILLPRIRDDIQEYKRLNFHLMMALKKALFKTSAFFKGIILALCESGDCTLREATIISSVLRESSVPMQHAGAAIAMIARMDYTGANSIFLRTLLDKKYALSYSVVDAVCEHFGRFINDDRELPVLWHQSLLTFVQRYKNDLCEEQRDLLKDLVKKHRHEEIAREVVRELDSAKPREK